MIRQDVTTLELFYDLDANSFIFQEGIADPKDHYSLGIHKLFHSQSEFVHVDFR
jgi:hypothetical protein